MPVKRNRFIRLVGADKSVNRTLEAKARALAGWKGYTTNLATCPDGTPVTPEFVIDAYHRLFQIEASFRMSKHDLAARPIYHHKRESIEAHLSVVFAALAVGRLVEERTGWSIRRFVRTARRYRTVQIRAGQQLLTAEDPLPDDLREALALVPANRYAKVAPAAPHAQHMPSHIYTRVGHWKESIDSNIASVKAAKAEKSVGNYLHAQDYMVYAHLQLGQDKQARAVMDEMMQETDFKATVLAAHYALAAAPARYAVERGDWNGASQLSVRPSPFNYVMAMSHFARALGAARSGKPDAAKPDIEKLAELRDKLREAKDAYWSEIVDIQRQVAAAWVLHAEGKYDEALKAMSAATDAEDKTEKHAVTPGPLAPARELYGFMLLDRGMAKEALAAFEATKAKEPNRFRGFLGAATAAEKLGDKAKAKDNYEKLVALSRERRFRAAGGRGGEEVSRQQLARPGAKPVPR